MPQAIELIGIVLELLPARVDFFSFVLQFSGFTACLGTGVTLYRRRLAGEDALVPSYAERYTLAGTGVSTLGFPLLYLAQMLY